jgi:hypothetical protein
MSAALNSPKYNVGKTVKSRRGVVPANAGIQNILKILDSGFQRMDGKSGFRTFYIAVNVD